MGGLSGIWQTTKWLGHDRCVWDHSKYCSMPWCLHYNDAIMSTMASKVTGVSIVCSTLASATDQRKHESSASRAFVWGIHWWPVNSQHRRPVTQKMFPSDEFIICVFLYVNFPVCLNTHICILSTTNRNYTPSYNKQLRDMSFNHSTIIWI